MNTNDMTHDQRYCRTPYRQTFASFTGRAGQPMDFDGDFDDHFTAEDYDRRRAMRDGWRTDSWDRYCR